MADCTDPRLHNQIMYSIFVRNHTPEGTFRAVIPDLPRIRSLGTDIVWLMPIHPIGVQCRTGTMGSPYANQDYRAVNPDYGTLDDLKALVEAIHGQGMRVIIDVVYNHTSPDSVLWRTHPEFFYKRSDGRPGNHVGDWTDIIDLDYTVPALWDYQIETLVYWASLVDGFRCDVASLVPVEFWKRARAACEQVRPGCLWLAESVHLGFNHYCRSQGLYAARDPELHQAFDLSYEYDIREAFEKYLRGQASLSHYLDMLNLQDFLYSPTAIKLRFLENHDQPRIASLVPEESDLINFTAMLYFLKGTTLLFGGQEVESAHLPALFERDPVTWHTGKDLSPLLIKLARYKKEVLSPTDTFFAKADDEHHVAMMTRDNGKTRKLGVFSLRSQKAQVTVDLADGVYTDYLTGEPVTVAQGRLTTQGAPLLLGG